MRPFVQIVYVLICLGRNLVGFTLFAAHSYFSNMTLALFGVFCGCGIGLRNLDAKNLAVPLQNSVSGRENKNSLLVSLQLSVHYTLLQSFGLKVYGVQRNDTWCSLHWMRPWQSKLVAMAIHNIK